MRRLCLLFVTSLSLVLPLSAVPAAATPAAGQAERSTGAPAAGSPAAPAIDFRLENDFVVRPQAKGPELDSESAGFVIGGSRWPGRTITYWNALHGKQYRKGVKKALAEWNARGLPIRFAKARSASSADFRISHSTRIGAGGRATLGYTPGYDAWMKLNMKGDAWEDVAWVASHELGHILGLHHSTGCAVMSYSAFGDCRWPDQRYGWRCRLQEKDDLLGARRLYGGDFKRRKQLACLYHPAPGPLEGLTAVPSTRFGALATLRWRPARRAHHYLVAGMESPSGACPPADPNRTFTKRTSGTTLVVPAEEWETPVVPTPYCFRVWSANVDGYAPESRKVTFVVKPPIIAPPTRPTAQVTLAASGWPQWDLHVTSDIPAGADTVRVARKKGTCPASIDSSVVWLYNGYTSEDLYLDGLDFASGDRLCVRFWAVRADWVSTPVDRWVTLP